MKGKLFVNTAQSGDEVIFERADGTFGSVATVKARRYELIIDFLFLEERLECCRAFVVEAMQLWT